uniref:Uncharacterized protein n=1 Tax=Propionibacterium freudenreichii TaxID=1744 RepID=A0A2C6ZMQ0_9ACTN
MPLCVLARCWLRGGVRAMTAPTLSKERSTVLHPRVRFIVFYTISCVMQSAVRTIEMIFFVLAVCVTVVEIFALTGVREAEHSLVGLAITILSLIMMPGLAWFEFRTGRARFPQRPGRGDTAAVYLSVRHGPDRPAFKQPARTGALVDAERECCAFARWGIDDSHRLLQLTVTTPSGQLQALNIPLRSHTPAAAAGLSCEPFTNPKTH